MLTFWLLIIAIIVTLIHSYVKKSWKKPKWAETFLAYLLFFNVGIAGLLGFYAHIFMADTTAQLLGWASGSPFQYQVGMVDLAYGVLGIVAFWVRKRFWSATVLGFVIIMLGCFIGHMIQWGHGDTASYNISWNVWVEALAVPLLLIVLHSYYTCTCKK